MQHSLYDAGVPHLEQVVDNELLSAYLFVCRHCYQVELHAIKPSEDKDVVRIHITIVNPGNGSELCK